MCCRSRRYVKSGRTRSTPRCSSRGNARPASTTTIEPSASKTVMFLPTSPRPPSGMIRQTPITGQCRRDLGGRRAEDPSALEAAADLVELLLGRVDYWQAVSADLVPEQIERRLDRDRVCLHLQEVVGGRQLVVQLPRTLDVAVPVPANHLL